MSNYIKINKVIDSVGDPIPSFVLTLKAVESSGIPTAIFLHKYIPTSPYSGQTALEFYNVAYPDEIDSVSDTVQNPRSSCYVRRDTVSKTFSDFDKLSEFLDIVTADLSRLIKYTEDFNNNKDTFKESLVITGDDVTSSDFVDQSYAQQVHKSDKSTQRSSSQYELNSDNTDVIIVGIDGR